MSAHEGRDPEEYRRELLDMGADPGDANAAVENLNRQQGGDA